MKKIINFIKNNKTFTFIIIIIGLIVLSGIFNLISKAGSLRVLSISPQLNNPISPTQQITLTLNKTITTKQLDECFIQISPETNAQLKTSEKNIIISFLPTLQIATSYNLVVNCENRQLTELFFTTKNYDQLSDEEIAAMQIDLDYDFASGMEKYYDQNPWKKSLPIITELFEIVYSDINNVYYAIAKIPPNSNITTSDLEQQIQTKLIEINAPILPIEWR